MSRLALLVVVGLVGCNQTKEHHVDAGNVTDKTLADDGQKKAASWLMLSKDGDGFSPQSVAVDSSTNIYVSGMIRDVVTLGGSSHGVQGADSAFVLKLNSSGKIQWVRLIYCNAPYKKGFKGYNLPPCTYPTIGVDSNGNSVITGIFTGTINFGNDISLSSIENVIWPKYPRRDIFVARFDEQGKTNWARMIGEYQETEEANAIAVDEKGIIYVAGEHEGETNFGKMKVGTKDYPASTWQAFVTKIDAKGNFLWVASPDNKCKKSYSACGGGDVEFLAVNKGGEVVISGQFNGNVAFGATLLSHEVPMSPMGYVARLDPIGKFKWARKTTGIYPVDVAWEPSGTILLNRHGTIDRLSRNGTAIWSRTYCSTNQMSLGNGSLAVSHNGRIVMSGSTGHRDNNEECAARAIPSGRNCNSFVVATKENGAVSGTKIGIGVCSSDITANRKHIIMVGRAHHSPIFDNIAVPLFKIGAGFVWNIPDLI